VVRAKRRGASTIMRAKRISAPAIKEIAPTTWLVTCQNAEPSDETIEGIQDACLNALDRGALTLAVDLHRMVAISEEAIEVLSITAELLAARGGSLWLVWPQLDEQSGFRVLSFDENSRQELAEMAGRGGKRPSTPSAEKAGRR
jgi:hypothetical protein